MAEIKKLTSKYFPEEVQGKVKPFDGRDAV
jgi:hypothetical protein